MSTKVSGKKLQPLMLDVLLKDGSTQILFWSDAANYALAGKVKDVTGNKEDKDFVQLVKDLRK